MYKAKQIQLNSNIKTIKGLAEGLLMDIETGEADWESVEDVLECIMEYCN